MKIVTTFFYLLIATLSFAQDTLKMDALKVNTSFLKPSTNQYLVYSKNGKDSSRIKLQFWTRQINEIEYKGKKTISVNQEWSDNDTIIHKVHTVLDNKNFSTLLHESWWRRGPLFLYDFMEKKMTVNARSFTPAPGDTIRQKMYDTFIKATEAYTLNWHLDLEIFSILPYKNGITFLLNLYDPGLSPAKEVAYTVSGSEQLSGYGKEPVECWLLKHNTTTSKETFWIDKKTRMVMKMEQESGGKFRYKIRLPFAP